MGKDNKCIAKYVRIINIIKHSGDLRSGKIRGDALLESILKFTSLETKIRTSSSFKRVDEHFSMTFV